MGLDEVLEAVNARLKKDKAGRTTRPSAFNPIISLVNLKMFNKKAGLPEAYQPGQPVPPEALDVTKQISEDLDFALTTINPKMYSSGFIPKPKDFARMSYLWTVYGKNGVARIRPVRLVFGNNWATVGASPLTRPSARNPVYTHAGGKFEVAPSNVVYGVRYYRFPKTPYYDYIVKNEQPVFLPPGAKHDGTGPMPSGALSRSVNPEWRNNVMTAFIDMVYEEISMSIRDQRANQDAWMHKTTGT